MLHEPKFLALLAVATALLSIGLFFYEKGWKKVGGACAVSTFVIIPLLFFLWPESQPTAAPSASVGTANKSAISAGGSRNITIGTQNNYGASAILAVDECGDATVPDEGKVERLPQRGRVAHAEAPPRAKAAR